MKNKPKLNRGAVDLQLWISQSSYERVAKLAGVSRSTIWELANGTRLPSRRTEKLLFDNLGILGEDWETKSK